MDIMIWEIRKEKKITLDELSDKTGISRSTLSNIEDELKSPTLLQLQKIAKGLNCKMSDLYWCEEM